jgi:hypothetical protein
MDTEEGFENASYESSEGDTISGSENEPWSESEGTESSSDSEGGESTSKVAQETQVPLTAYEESRLKRIERNKRKLEELGLHPLASEVGVLKAEKGRQVEHQGAGRLGVSQQGGRLRGSRGHGEHHLRHPCWIKLVSRCVFLYIFIQSLSSLATLKSPASTFACFRV